MSTNVLNIVQRRETTMHDETKRWFVRQKLTHLYRHEWLFDNDGIVQLYSLMLRLLYTYSCVVSKTYDILTKWEADEEAVTSLVFIGKIVSRELAIPESELLQGICEQIIMLSN